MSVSKLLCGLSACVLMLSVPAVAQDKTENIAAIMRLLGVSDIEEIPENEVESLCACIQHPLRINLASQSRLVASGLLTRFQVASLLDYRARNGDILSFSELAAVNGFGGDWVERLRPFISLEGKAAVGTSSAAGGKFHSDLILRTAGRNVGNEKSGFDYNYGLKYRAGAGDRLEGGIALNRPYACDRAFPSSGTFFLACYGRRNLGKFVAGDYNLRFGQGLALWSGFSMSSVSYPEAFFRKPSGISPYLSFSGSGGYTGMAADFEIGKITVSAAMGFGGLKKLILGDKTAEISLQPAVNVGYLGRIWQASATFCAETGSIYSKNTAGLKKAMASADVRACVRGVDLFGEIALDCIALSPLAVAGVACRAGEKCDLAFRGRYSGKEYGISAGGKFSAGKWVNLAGKEGFGASAKRHSGTFCVDFAYFPYPKYKGEDSDWQLKAAIDYKLQISPQIALTLRLSERLRSSGETGRHEVRTDLKWSDGRWNATMRLDAVYCTAPGVLSYIEGGCQEGIFSAYLRAGIFMVDNWSDRIYAYERDAPGNFNVPAYYGRGVNASAVLGLKVSRLCRLYLRLSTLQYPFPQPRNIIRPGKTEARLQVVVSI